MALLISNTVNAVTWLGESVERIIICTCKFSCLHLHHTVLCNPLSQLWRCMLNRKGTRPSSRLIMLSLLLSW